MANVLIAGCGYVGTALGLELLAAGDRVWGLRRTASHLPAGFQAIGADLSSPSALEGLPRGIDYIVYCASADDSSDAAYVKAYVTGLQRLLDTLDRSNVRRVFFTSSTAVYAQADGQWVDEASETKPTYFSGVRLLEAEAVLRTCGLASTVLRCAGIYGPGRTRLIDSVRQGTAKASERFTNRIHRDDVAGAIAYLLRCEQVPELLLLTDDEPAAERAVLDYLARCLGVPAPPSAPPPAAPASPLGTALRGGSKRCRNAGLRATGYVLRYPSYREGYAPLLAGSAPASEGPGSRRD
jgi:nucleoside-diphosphate-sugar epimerase